MERFGISDTEIVIRKENHQTNHIKAGLKAIIRRKGLEEPKLPHLRNTDEKLCPSLVSLSFGPINTASI